MCTCTENYVENFDVLQYHSIPTNNLYKLPVTLQLRFFFILNL